MFSWLPQPLHLVQVEMEEEVVEVEVVEVAEVEEGEGVEAEEETEMILIKEDHLKREMVTREEEHSGKVIGFALILVVVTQTLDGEHIVTDAKQNNQVVMVVNHQKKWKVVLEEAQMAAIPFKFAKVIGTAQTRAVAT